MGQAALQYDEFEDIEPIEVPAGGIASFLTATEGSWATDDANDLPDTGIAQVKRVADQLATYGRHEDEYMIHAAEGETVIPMEVFRKNPILKDRIFQQMRDMGIEPERYVVGNELNSLNPVTGQPEFFLKKLFSGLKKFVKKAVTVVLPIVGGAFFGPLGAAAGSGIATLINGGNIKDALKSAAISGLTAGVMNGISGGMSAAGEGGSFFQGFKAGAVGEGAFTRTIGEAAAAGGAQAAEAAAAASTLEKVATDPLQTQALMTGDAAKQEAMAKALSTPKMPQIVPESTVPITPRSPLDPVNQLAGAQTSTGAGLQTGAGTTPVTMQAITKPTQAMYDANAGGLRAVVNADPGNPLYSNIQTTAGTAAPTTPPIIGSDGTIDIGSDLSAAASQAPATTVGGAPAGAGAVSTATTVPVSSFRQGIDRLLPGGELGFDPVRGFKDVFMPRAGQRAAAEQLVRTQQPGLAVGSPNFEAAVKKIMDASTKPGLIRSYAPAIGGIMALDALSRQEPQDYNVAEQVTGFDLREQNPYKYELGPGTMRLPSTYTIQDVSSQYTPIKAPVYQPVPLDVAQGGEIENFPRMNGRIDGPGTETSDDIPAMLSDGEFVFTAKAVRGAGNGSRENGMQNMYDLMSKFERMA
tara:strand:- start:181 stop:2097 length:1917 start_codon:yes stop_codon:yes gene_type:complete